MRSGICFVTAFSLLTVSYRPALRLDYLQDLEGIDPSELTDILQADIGLSGQESAQFVRLLFLCGTSAKTHAHARARGTDVGAPHRGYEVQM